MPTEDVVVQGVADGGDEGCLFAVDVVDGTYRTLYCPPPATDGAPARATPQELRLDLGKVPVAVDRLLAETGPLPDLEVAVVDIATGTSTTPCSIDDKGALLYEAMLVEADGWWPTTVSPPGPRSSAAMPTVAWPTSRSCRA